MVPDRPQRTDWRGRVQSWLADVLADVQRQHPFLDYRIYIVESARNLQRQFPRKLLLSFLKFISLQFFVRPVVRSAIGDAAEALGVSLDGSTLDEITELAMLAL